MTEGAIDLGDVRDAVRTEPEIREAAELFDGTVIDIHRPVGQ